MISKLPILTSSIHVLNQVPIFVLLLIKPLVNICKISDTRRRNSIQNTSFVERIKHAFKINLPVTFFFITRDVYFFYFKVRKIKEIVHLKKII